MTTPGLSSCGMVTPAIANPVSSLDPLNPNAQVSAVAQLRDRPNAAAIGETTLIGINATVMDGATIGENCVIGAHCVVPEGMQISDNSVVVGVPARYIHSHVGLFDWRDYVAASKLVLEVVLALDSDRVAGVTRFD